jgi:hypothetical protein
MRETMIPMKRTASARGSFGGTAWLGPALVMLLALSCGGSGDSGGGSPCAQVGAATCNEACACTDGPGCNITQGAVTLSFDTEADCRGFLVTLSCSDSTMPAYNDAAACLPLVQAATCTGTGTEAALAFPTDTVCQTPP